MVALTSMSRPPGRHNTPPDHYWLFLLFNDTQARQDHQRPRPEGQGVHEPQGPIEAVQVHLRLCRGELGVTKSTRIRAEVGEILEVKPAGMQEKEDGALKWEGAEAIRLLTDAEPGTEQETDKEGLGLIYALEGR